MRHCRVKGKVPSRKYRSIGLFILESEVEDRAYLIADRDMRMNAFFSPSLIKKAKNSGRLSMILANQLLNFLEKHREERKKIALRKAEHIRRTDLLSGARIQKLIEADSLRRAESAIEQWQAMHDLTREE